MLHTDHSASAAAAAAAAAATAAAASGATVPTALFRVPPPTTTVSSTSTTTTPAFSSPPPPPSASAAAFPPSVPRFLVAGPPSPPTHHHWSATAAASFDLGSRPQRPNEKVDTTSRRSLRPPSIALPPTSDPEPPSAPSELLIPTASPRLLSPASTDSVSRSRRPSPLRRSRVGGGGDDEDDDRNVFLAIPEPLLPDPSVPVAAPPSSSPRKQYRPPPPPPRKSEREFVPYMPNTRPVEKMKWRKSEGGPGFTWRVLLKWVGSIFSVIGAGGFVAVGYMDPGNWSTDINAGSKFGYSLLFIILFSNLMAIALQSLCVRLGVVTGHDLAELCRLKFHPVVNTILWILAEIAIAATDLAEVIGAAIALNLLFGLPLTYGVAITVADVLLILVGWREKYFRFYEILISVLIFGIGVCFVIIIAKLSPYWPSAFSGFIPSSVLISNNDALFASMGIVGATIMPHNLYLHSALVQFRSPYKEINAPRHVPTVFPQSVKKSMKASLRHLNTDSFVSLSYAFVVNSAILITAAAATLRDGTAIESVQDTYHLLDGSLGRFSAVIFAVGLFLSGQSATITGTLAGQAVMEGFLGGFDHLDGPDPHENEDSDGLDERETLSDESAHHEFLTSQTGLPLTVEPMSETPQRDFSLSTDTLVAVRTAPGRPAPVGDAAFRRPMAPPLAHADRSDTLLSIDDLRSSASLAPGGGARGGDSTTSNDGAGRRTGWWTKWTANLRRRRRLGARRAGAPTPSSQVALTGHTAAQRLGSTSSSAAGDSDFLFERQSSERGLPDAAAVAAVAAAAKRPRKKRSIISRLVVFFRRNVWARRLITRGLAVLPALVCSASLGEDGINKLLNLSQVVLSLLLPFSVWPLVVFTSSKRVMTVKYCNCGAGVDAGGGDEGGASGDGSREGEDAAAAAAAGDFLVASADEMGAGALSMSPMGKSRSATTTAVVVGERNDGDVGGGVLAAEGVGSGGGSSTGAAAAAAARLGRPAKCICLLQPGGPGVESESEEEGRACSAGAVLPEEVSYESSWPMTVVGVVIGLILTGLNLYLLIEGGVTL